jgi:hypothetical protein
MNAKPPPSKLNTALLMIGFVMVLIVGMCVFSIGLDWLGKATQGGVIEKLLNWIVGAWFWCVIGFFALAMLASAVFGKREK